DPAAGRPRDDALPGLDHRQPHDPATDPAAGRPRDDALPGLPNPVHPHRAAAVLRRTLPQDRVPPTSPRPAHHSRRPRRPAPTTDHHLRMPQLRGTAPRRTALPGMRHLHPPRRHRRAMPPLRRARRPRRAARPRGDHHAQPVVPTATTKNPPVDHKGPQQSLNVTTKQDPNIQGEAWPDQHSGPVGVVMLSADHPPDTTDTTVRPPGQTMSVRLETTSPPIRKSP